MSQRYIGGLIYNPPGGFSGYFDGSGDFLTWTGTAAGAGAFCYEFWIFSQNGFATMRAPLGVIATSGYNSALDIRMTGSTINVSQYNVATNNFTVDPLQANTWYHIAVCRNASNQTTVFVNGVRSSTGAVTLATNFSGLTSAIGRLDPSNGGDVTGYITNVRLITGSTPYDPTQTTITVPSGPLQAITGTQFLSCAYPTFRDGSSNNFTITVNGNTAVSTQNPFPQTQLPNPALGNQGNGVYSMSQYQALRSQNLWPAIDPWFDYVTLMLHGNGTNGAQNNTFLDSSTNNFTITRNGNTTQGTFSPYGSNWSNYFDGSGDSLDFATNAAFTMGTGDFTIELWYMPMVSYASGNCYLFDLGTNGTRIQLYLNQITFIPVAGSGVTGSAGTGMAVGVWYHIVVVRSGSTITVYLNGTSIGSVSNSSNLTDNDCRIADYGAGGYGFNGYISNFRIVKGTAVYTANFTPSTAPLTAITNTSLLTCQSNRFIDNSSNNFTITRNGDVSVQRFSPFNPTTPYAAGTIGGSGYFDGNGDYLSVASNAAFGYGTGDFTIECWFNIDSIPGGTNGSFLIDQRTTGSQAAIVAYVYADSTLVLVVNGGVVITGGTVIPKQWNHFALARSGTTTKMFLNGVQVGSNYTDTNNYASLPVIIGARFQFDAGQFFPGYISNFRILKGTALYTTTFTPPATPLTAITNTSLLLNFTNGGIIDNAMMNDLETVGNAQISTSVSRFGGGSLAFDGTDDRLTAPASPNLAFNTGDFTVEGWIYTGSTGNLGVFQISGTAGGLQANQTNNTAVYCNNLVLGAYYGGTFKTGTTPIVANTWTHFALVRSSSVTRLYVNGVLDSGFGSNSDTQNYTGQNICVGGYFGTSNLFNGNIDDFRVTRGYARYTANFTPQRSQWQDQ